MKKGHEEPSTMLQKNIFAFKSAVSGSRCHNPLLNFSSLSFLLSLLGRDESFCSAKDVFAC